MEFANRVAAKRDLLMQYILQTFRIDSATAEDIVHDALANSLHKQEQFLGGDYEAALVSWLKKIAFRKGLKAVDPIRKPLEVGTNDRPDSAGSPSQYLRLVEARDRIYDAVAGLSETQRAVVTFVFFKGWSVKQVAAELEMAENSVSRVKARAIEKLAGLLSPEDFQTWLR